MMYIVLLFFIVATVLCYKKYWGVSTYLIGVYLLAMIFSIKLYWSDPFFRFASFIGSIVYVLELMLYFKPYMRVTPMIAPISNPIIEKRFCNVGYALGGLLILGMILMAPKIKEVAAYGFGDARSSMYREGADSYITAYSGTERIGSIILGWLGGMSYVLLMMFFYAFTFIDGKKMLKVILIISSFSASYQGLMVAGRTKIMYWMMFFLLCAVIFMPLMDHRKKKRICIFGGSFLALAFGYFMFMTLARSTMSGYDTGDFISRYMGEPYLYFCEFWEKYELQNITLGRLFPLSYFIFEGGFDLNAYRSEIDNLVGMNIGIFYTHLGDFLVDVGFVGMTIISILYYYVGRKLCRSNIFSISRLIVFCYLIQIPLHGLFYYSLWKEASSFCTLLTLVIAYYLHDKYQPYGK